VKHRGGDQDDLGGDQQPVDDQREQEGQRAPAGVGLGGDLAQRDKREGERAGADRGGQQQRDGQDAAQAGGSSEKFIRQSS
jgi:hypothetical protein